MKISIQRLDYKNWNGMGYPLLPRLDSIDCDINEIQYLSLGDYDNREEAEELLKKFPKTYKAMLSRDYSIERGNFWNVVFKFNTFFTNRRTGEINESAVLRRIRVINKVLAIMS
jgi:hypothetical protein